jgi:hypothetical protein
MLADLTGVIVRLLCPSVRVAKSLLTDMKAIARITACARIGSKAGDARNRLFFELC